MTATFHLGVVLAGKAFRDFPALELARILRQLAADLEALPNVHLIHGRILRDANGNSAGSCHVVEPRIEQ